MRYKLFCAFLFLISIPAGYLVAQQGTAVIKSFGAARYADVDTGHNLLVRSSTDTPCYVKGGTGTTNDTTNHANCKAALGSFLGVRAINTSGTLAYLRMYNLATDATCTSATGFTESIPIPANTSGSGFIDVLSNYSYSAGIAYCVTGAGTSTDNSAPPAGVYITISTN